LQPDTAGTAPAFRRYPCAERHAEAQMPYKTKAEQEREKWMTLPDAIVHICSANGFDEKAARRQLIAALLEGARVLQPLKWDRERGDKSPPFWPTSIMSPMDTPPLGYAWSDGFEMIGAYSKMGNGENCCFPVTA
jgi:hypothetical protein